MLNITAFRPNYHRTCMNKYVVLEILGRKCTLTALLVAPGESSWVEYAPRALLRLKRRDRQTDKRTDGRQTVALRLPLDAASVINHCQLSLCWSFLIDHIKANLLTCNIKPIELEALASDRDTWRTVYDTGLRSFLTGWITASEEPRAARHAASIKPKTGPQCH